MDSETVLLCRQQTSLSQVSWCHVQLAPEIRLVLVPASFSLLSRVLSHGKVCFQLYWYSSVSIFGCLWPQKSQNLLVWTPERMVSFCLFLSTSPLSLFFSSLILAESLMVLSSLYIRGVKSALFYEHHGNRKRRCQCFKSFSVLHWLCSCHEGGWVRWRAPSWGS